MKATILTVGTEILFGSIVNTHAVYLSQHLNDLGIDVIRHLTVGDNEARLLEALDEGYKDCELVIATGGLGPTEDDMTKEVVSKYFGLQLEENKEETARIKDWFESQGRTMAENNRKQAFMPKGSTFLPNPNGTAPGFYYTDGKRHICVMPGPPREMHPMFENYVSPILENLADGRLYYKMIRLTGLGEADLETKLFDLIDNQTDPTIATYAKEFESTLRVASKRPTLKEAQDAVEDMMVEIRKRIGDYIYSEDNEELLAVVIKKMKEKGYMLASAESMTGGMFGKLVTDIPGTSTVYDRGIIAYAHAAKMFELDVMPETLARYGPVSALTVQEMVRGLAVYSECSTCIAVTGYAGPTAEEGKEVGLYYIGLIHNGQLDVREFHSKRKNRDDVRLEACMNMARMLYEYVK